MRLHDTREHSTPYVTERGVSDFRKCCNVHVHTAPQIVKIESRFITTLDVVHYLALLARLYLLAHVYIRARARKLAYTSLHTITQSHIHS